VFREFAAPPPTSFCMVSSHLCAVVVWPKKLKNMTWKQITNLCRKALLLLAKFWILRTWFDLHFRSDVCTAAGIQTSRQIVQTNTPWERQLHYSCHCSHLFIASICVNEKQWCQYFMLFHSKSTKQTSNMFDFRDQFDLYMYISCLSIYIHSALILVYVCYIFNSDKRRTPQRVR